MSVREQTEDVAANPANTANAVDYKALYEQEQAKRATAENQAKAAQEAQFEASAESFVKGLSVGAEARFTPGEIADRKAEFLLAARDDHAHPVEGRPRARQEALERAHSARKPHNLYVEAANADPATKNRALGMDPSADKPEADLEAAKVREAQRKATQKFVQDQQAKA